MFLLSIIIPVYNAEKTIGRTLASLNSLAMESRKVTQVTIVNDGTPDGSMGIVEAMRTSLAPLDFVIVDQENQGLAAARNSGLRRSGGEFIFFLDSDDELAFDPLPLIQQHRDTSALGFSVRYSRNSKKMRTKRPLHINLRNHLDIFSEKNAFTVSSIIFRKDRITTLFDTSFFSLEDWLFWISNPRIFENVRIFPAVTSAIIHFHGENMSLDIGKMGTFRRRVAEQALDTFKNSLTRKQKNNLLIQARIGSFLKGDGIPFSAFILVPCAPALYMRLILFVFFGRKIAALGFYGN